MDLITKYSGQVPRYTSYPTAVELKPTEDPSVVKRVLGNCFSASLPLSLYVHLPFCPSLCYFCACNKIITQDETQKGAYLKLLREEVGLLVREAGGKLTVTQVHLGGGSPSYLCSSEIEELMGLLSDNFLIKPEAQLSVEVDPRTIDLEKARTFYALGFRRISLGIQDFDPKVQQIINREQSFELVNKVVTQLREVGFTNFNFDLIYGLPGQTAANFSETMDKVIELCPDKVALYGYAHVQWKTKVQNVFNKHPLPSPQERGTLFGIALERFQAAGYRHLGLDHFSLPEDELSIAESRHTLTRNFMGYSQVLGQGVLGVGVSSISDISGVMFQNFSQLKQYSEAVSTGKLPIWRILERDKEDSIRAKIIEEIMCYGSLSRDRIIEFFPEEAARVIEFFKQNQANLETFIADGLIEGGQSGFKVTKQGRLFLRNIAASFDSYLTQKNTANEKVFSQAV